MSDNEFHVRRCDFHLLKAVFDTSEAVSDVGKTSAIENGFLNPCYEAKSEVLADFTDFPKETEVEYEGLITSATKIIEKLINYDKQAQIREFLLVSEDEQKWAHSCTNSSTRTCQTSGHTILNFSTFADGSAAIARSFY